MALVRALIVAASLALAATAADAQQGPAPKPAASPNAPLPQILDPKGFTTDFFSQLQKSGPSAYDKLKDAGLAPQGVDNLKQTAGRLIESVGPLVATEFIDEARLGKTLTRLTYVEQHQKGPVMQNLTFYLPPRQTSWRLIGMEMTAEPGRFPFALPK